jgi:hypothetical protein
MAKLIYRTNSAGELIHTYEDANKVFLEMGETYKAPPAKLENTVAILNPQTDTWTRLPDFRGNVYYAVSGEKVTITKIGDVVPNEAILSPPPNKYYDSYDVNNRVWVFNYNDCRRDLTALIEQQEGYNQINGVKIGDVVWDTDLGAHLKYGQILSSLNRVDINNLKNGTNIPFEPFEDFQVNSETFIDLTATHVEVYWHAIEHHLRTLFKWSRESRLTIASTNNVDSLLLLFTSLTFNGYDYDAAGAPIVG